MYMDTRVLSVLTAFGLALLTPAGSVCAQQASEPVERLVQLFLQAQTAGLPGEVVLEVGQLDRSNQLPPCASMQAFLPAEVQAWGQLSVGVRCESPVTWTIYIPARVGIFTEYVVSARPIRPGQIIGPEDVQVVQGDLSAQPSGVITDVSRIIGHHARVAIGTGQSLRTDMLRLPLAIRQGQTVKVIGSGSGFSVTHEGRALNRAGEGEQVRVRLSNGHVVSGVALSEGQVFLRF